MRLMSFTSLAVIAASLTLSACGSTDKTNANDMGMNIPSWVTNPVKNDGMAASTCVLASNSFSTDKAQAASLARAELAANLETRVSKLQESYTKKITSMGKSVDEETLKITALELTDQSLRGSKIEKVDYAQMGENRNLCVLVTVTAEKAKDMFDQLIKTQPIQLDPENETLLYLNFIQSEQSPK